MTTALKMHERGDSVVIPVILHPCDWHSAPFGKLSAVPIDGKPISKYANQHDAYLDVTKAIREVLSKLTKTKSISHEVLPNIDFDIRTILRKKDLDHVLTDIFHFVYNDQIPESGGWGVSHAHVFKYLYGTTPSAVDLREGGIGSTFLAIRSLLSAGAKINSTNEVGRKVLKYLLDRQDHTGGFGRFSKTRSGEEIHTSYRHTALAVMVIILLDGPSQMVLNALDYLDKLTKNDVLNDSAPSIVCAALLLCFEWLISKKWSARNLT